ncbi:MAG: glycosyltransferase [Patescibacteria group bacterium]|nr:glycosyltransferase [Patescibacteria group bacterium]MDE2116371.1 glycosyltransferase [Patescibacteria group bacterium]
MQKLSLAFIDHSFHKKSRSGDFLREIFRERFDIVDYWDESWHGGLTVSPDDINKHDYAFYFQSLNPVSELRKIKVPILWAPMYDGIKFNYIRWKAISQFDIKVLSFSRRITKWLERFSMPVLSLQYYAKPHEGSPTSSTEGNRLFFWYRGDVSFDDLKRLIDPGEIKQFVYFENPDPNGQTTPMTDEDVRRFKIKRVSESFLPKEKYLDLVDSANIFVAPRRKEGIGMSFVEALARGKCVIGYKDATLDEYVTDGIDGLLFDEETKSLDMRRVVEIAAAARSRAAAGYATWLSEREKIPSFLLEPYRARRSALSVALWSTLDSCAAFYRKVRYYVSTKLWNRSSP